MIADDYIPYNYIPNSSGGHKPNQGNTNYKAYFTNILFDDYSGSASITDARMKALNNDYFTKGYTSTNQNMKAVAYMLDTNAWSVYAGDKADYAVGGPSIEMLMKSYSEKYGVDYRAQASSATGYQISNNGGSSWANDTNSILNTSDSTYVINSTTKANGVWLASPSAYHGYDLMTVDWGGYVYYSGYDRGDRGFRPLVCLKSDVTLQDNGDGTYTIK